MNIEELRQLCLSLPSVTEDVKWEDDLCFCIGEKMFAVTGLVKKGGEGKASFKVLAEEYESLIGKEGIVPAPYLARYKWVLANYESLSKEEWTYFIRQSYQLVKAKLPARVRKNLD